MYFCYFYPVGLDLERRRQPWLSVLLIGSILAVFCWQLWLPDRLPVHPWDLIYFAGNSPAWTAVTALLLHGGWLHLLGNLVYLFVFLPALEDRLGRVGVLLLFLAAGAGGNLAHGVAAWQNWLGQGGLGILGASGAISGLLGYALVRLPHARLAVVYWVLAPLQGQNRAGRCFVPLPLAVLGWLLLQVVQATLASASASQVSYPAHLGGFTLGLVLALVMRGQAEARAESSLLQARRYLSRGQGLAAVGAYANYLQSAPDDLDAACEQVRALVMAGLTDEAVAGYRALYRRAANVGRWDLALPILAEGRRARRDLGLSVEELAAAAHQAEKAAERTLALHLYTELVQKDDAHPLVARAWIRLLLLLHADPRRCAELGDWLQRARRTLPPGPWREYLEQTFSPAPAGRAGPAADPSSPLAGSGP